MMLASNLVNQSPASVFRRYNKAQSLCIHWMRRFGRQRGHAQSAPPPCPPAGGGGLTTPRRVGRGPAEPHAGARTPAGGRQGG
eukprot:2433906-Pyramimonas_sp.AAC.1